MIATLFLAALCSTDLILCLLLGFLVPSGNSYGNVRSIHRGKVSSGGSCVPSCIELADEFDSPSKQTFAS